MPDVEDEMTSPPIVPLMPTGSGVADLEIAREQSALAEAGEIIPPEQPPMNDAAGGPQAEDPESPINMPTEGGKAEENSAAHPS